jgi:hypothetical protein
LSNPLRRLCGPRSGTPGQRRQCLHHGGFLRTLGIDDDKPVRAEFRFRRRFVSAIDHFKIFKAGIGNFI